MVALRVKMSSSCEKVFKGRCVGGKPIGGIRWRTRLKLRVFEK